MKKVIIALFAILAVSCDDVVHQNILVGPDLTTRSAVMPENCVFKCVPGTTEWAKLEGISALKEASQIKDELITKMTDDELAQSLLDYPLAYHYTAFENEYTAVDDLMKSFNGLSELNKRPGGFHSVVKCYQEIEFNPNNLERNVYNVSTSFNMGFLELILANDRMLNTAGKEDLDLLKKAAVSGYEMKLSHPEYFGLLSVKRSLMLCSAIALKEELVKGKDRELLEKFVTSYTNPSMNEELTSLSKLIMETIK